MRKLIIIIVVFVSAVHNLWGFQPTQKPFSWDELTPQYSVRHFTTEDGLPVNSVQQILAHTDGFVYISTFDGLVRYDGHRFVVYNTANSSVLRRNRINKMVGGPEDKIWILDTAGNFYEFQYGTFKLLNDRIFSERVTVYNVYKYASDTLYVLTDKGLFTTIGDGHYRRVKSTLNKSPGATIDYMRGIVNAEKDTLSDSTVFPDGVLFEGRQIIKPNYHSEDIPVDLNGSYWIQTDKNGVYQVSLKKMITIGANVHPGLTNTYGIYEDKNGAIWVNASDYGLFRMQADKLTAWSGAAGALPIRDTRTFITLRNGKSYIGGSGGVWKLAAGGWVKPDKFIEIVAVDVLFEDDWDRFWVGSKKGFYLVDEESVTLFYDSNGTTIRKPTKITAYLGRGLLIATSGQGVALLNDSTFTFITTTDGLSSNFIRDIYAASEDTLWVVTEDLGLNRVILGDDFTPEEITVITTEDGLISNSLHRLIEDKFGYFWINSNGGIMRIHKDNLNAYADGKIAALNVQFFTQNDEIISSEGNGGVQSAGILTSTGALLFPSQAGIVYTRPEWHLNSSEVLIDPVAETITYADSSVSLWGKTSISIPKTTRDFQVRFTLPMYLNPEKLILEYKMEGINSAWQRVGEDRAAVFTNMPNGTFSFLMRGKIAGQSNYSQSSIVLKIPPYFYETTWFYLLLILCGAALIAGGYKVRVRNLKESEKKLQHRVDEQTQELQQAAEQKSRFFSGITHELKTPLSLIAGPLDDLADNTELMSSGKVKKRVALMRRNSKRLQILVDQILDVTKLNADAIKLNLQPVDIVLLTRRVAGQFQSQLEQEELSLVITDSAIKEPIYVDTDAWERIVINLLSNAIKFSPKKGTITLSFQEQESEISLNVKDEGAGIPEAYRNKVFEYLYQMAGKKAAEGTGIGLFLVKGLVEEMGGTISLQSKQGEGAEFIVTLQKGYRHFGSSHQLSHEPLAADTYQLQKSVADEVITEIPENSKNDRNSEAQVLVVEDNYDFRIYLQSVLSPRYRVLLAANGNEALEILQRKQPDLIISDIMMPEMNGLEFVNSLRKKKQFKHLPVIFLSAKSRDEDVETGLSTGADIYLSKPIRSNLLITQITAVLRREKALTKETFTKEELQEPDIKRQVRQIVYRHLADTSLSVNMLADALHISRAKLYMEWNKVGDISLNNFIKKMRLDEALVLMKERGFNVQEAARAVGYINTNYFSTSFKKAFGVPPSKADEISSTKP